MSDRVKLIDSSKRKGRKAREKEKKFERIVNKYLQEIGLEIDIDDFMTSLLKGGVEKTYRINKKVFFLKRKVGLLSLSTNKDYILVSLNDESILSEFKDAMEKIASKLDMDIHIVHNTGGA